MSGNAEGQRPTPLMIPRRRPAIPAAQRPPALSTYLAAAGIPRRGIPEAIVWPDTGVLLSLGTAPSLLDMFRSHYQGRMRIAKTVSVELRLWSERSTEELGDDDYDRVAAARLANQRLLVGPGSLQPTGAAEADLPAIDEIRLQLKALSETTSKKHGGEAEIIVLARRQAAGQSRKHIVLTNDGGASVIAGQHGLSSRHFGDILAEFACAQPDLDPAQCLRVFNASLAVSAPPARCRPANETYFTCLMTTAGCSACDAQLSAAG